MRTNTLRRFALTAVLVVAVSCTDSDDAADGGRPDGSRGDGRYEATIRRTTDGVAHIRADDLGSLGFGQGYASAEDRLCDLADQVVKVRGERARWFGAGDDDEHLTSDYAWKALDVHARAIDELPAASDDIRELIGGYTSGWNAYLAETGVDALPGWCRGEPWVQPITDEDLYAYVRAIALQASGARLTEFIADAQPPDPEGATDAGDDETSAGPLIEAPAASNAWAIGRERSEDGGGLLVGNPHFPWEGELRFWEVHLTIPGEVDVYGAQLSGLPGVGIGFTDTFGWTHTVSAGNRFTAYTLDLVEGDPTSYLYDGEQRQMSSRDIEIEVLQPDDTIAAESRTLWSTHYGPVLDFPGVGWTESTTITYRDANIDNSAFGEQYLAMNRARDLDDLIAAHAEHTGVPLFNTIAVSADGRAWYADTSATPNLSPEAIEAYDESIETDPIVAIAAQNGAVLLDGSDSRFEWVDEPGARSPGLAPYERMPRLERDDYVFNANDSFWLVNDLELLEGDYSPLHGRQETPRSPRTRENATLLRDTSPAGPAGGGGQFTLDELTQAALLNRGYTSRALKDEVVARCRGVESVDVPAFEGPDGDEQLPAATVAIGAACAALEAWDGSYDLDSVGAHVWRELISRYEFAQLTRSEGLWAEAFDASRPIDSPSGLAPPTADGDDPVLVRLGWAVQILDAAGVAPDAALGDLQFADRNGERVPIHGGDNFDGATNIVGYGTGWSTLEDIPRREETFAARSNLSSEGYRINNGTSFLMALHFGADGPEARVFLTYGQSEDRDSPVFVAATRRFSERDWRSVAFKNEAIATDRNLTEKSVRG
jgi:acyl-homoserine-lactone acylase